MIGESFQELRRWSLLEAAPISWSGRELIPSPIECDSSHGFPDAGLI